MWMPGTVPPTPVSQKWTFRPENWLEANHATVYEPIA